MLQRERDDLAAETYALVDRCLRREPRRRFQGMREFVEALDDALAAERLRVTNQAEQSAQGRHHPWGVVLTLLFLMVFLAASLMLLANGNGPMPTTEPTEVAIRGGDPPSAYPYPGDQGGEGGEATLESGGTLSGVPTRTPTATSTATPTATPTSTPRPSSTIAPTPTEEEMPAAAVSDTPAPQPAVRVVVPSASLRTGPGTDYRILDFLFEDEVVSVLAWNGEPESPWYVVLSGEGLVGWLAASTTEPVTAATEDNPLIVEGVPPAATIPVAPSPTATLTPTPTSTATPTPTVTLVVPIPDPPDNGGDGGEDVPPTVVPPTATELPADTPTATPPSLP
jgi:hypothetical protein